MTRPSTDAVECPHEGFQEGCPLPQTHDRFEEAHYWLHEMMRNYHTPNPMRFSLNAFLQALRSVTFMLQAEGVRIPAFEAWYAQKQADLRRDPVLRRFNRQRSFLVHEGMLRAKSRASMGIFRGRQLFFAVAMPVDPFEPSEPILLRTTKALTWWPADEQGNIIENGPFPSGHEYGVAREWVVDSLAESEVVGVCHTALEKIGTVVESAHRKLGRRFVNHTTCLLALPDQQVLLQSDLKRFRIGSQAVALVRACETIHSNLD